MKVNGIYCKNCKTFVYSRARHDFIWCNCEDESTQVAVDGGQQAYFRVNFGPKASSECKSLEVDVSLEELYDDWNRKIDKHGKIQM